MNEALTQDHAGASAGETSNGVRTEVEAVIEVRGLAKTYRVGFWRRPFQSLRGVDFVVRRGEAFGLLGPNGAGKTTTIKLLLGLAWPTSGTIRLFGSERPGPKERRRLGYLPENPYLYSYLRPLELLDLCGRLCGMGPAQRRRASLEVLERVGMSHAIDRPIGKMSKGMTQRIGLAQALLHDPELLILDEPMSGLDPIGRRQVRELLLEERARGKTLLVTSHILSDVEVLCDRVTILHQGAVVASGSLAELLRERERCVEVTVEGLPEELRARLASEVRHVRRRGGFDVLVVDDGAPLAALLRAALDAGARIVAVAAHRESLEDLFVRRTVGADSAPQSQTNRDATAGP
ncbi:MAG: ABC transporter ATP-binding protein [Myxococcota bacterium]|nr:ABC transporter ATP-binding protein [Myxococcota bacterium]MDW8363754.1 ABC transporter ATP-binding protein [Myxococcales bacterium]